MWPSGSLQVGSTVFDVSNTWILLDQSLFLTIWSEAKELIYIFFQFRSKLSLKAAVYAWVATIALHPLPVGVASETQANEVW